MKSIYQNCLFYFFLLFAQASVAQQYSIKHFTPQNGLANSFVQQILQDKEGYIWIATEGGLSRFDGKKFRNYYVSNGLASNQLISLLEDHSGAIWIGSSDEGVCKYNGIGFTTYKGFGLASIYSIIEDSNKNIWFASFGGGLIRYDGKSFVQFTKKDGLPTDTIFSVLQDSKGDLWVGTYHYGVCKISKQSLTSTNLEITQFTKSDGLTSNNILCLLEPKPGTIWLGSTNGGINCIENGKASHIFISNETEQDQIGSLIKDKRGNIWIATYEHGLLKYHNNVFSFYNSSNGLSSNINYSVFQDKESNIWVGTDQGLCLFKNEAFVTSKETDGLPSNLIKCFTQLSENTLLCGTANGIFKITDGKSEEITSVKELTNTSITALASDPSGNIYIGTMQGIALCNYNKSLKLKHFYTQADNTALFPISDILIDKAGSAFVATFGSSLFKFENGKILHYDQHQGLNSKSIYNLFEDHTGNIWLATLDGGAVKFDGKSFTSLTKKNGLSDNTIFDIAQDNKLNMVFATREQGLDYFDGKKVHNFNPTNGLISNLISCVVIDKKNNFWLGTDKGLNKITLTEYKELDISKFYTDNSGLAGVEFGLNSLYIDTKDVLWIGTTNGLTRFNPALEYPNTIPPKLTLQDIRLSYQKVNWKTLADSVDLKTGLPVNLKLDYKNNHLTFDFQAISTDENMKYRYMLEGLENRWSPTTTATEAIYANIPSGKSYTFRVQAMNSDGVWSEQNIEFKFTILSPIWQRWWFIALSIVLLLVIIFLYINWRTAKLAAEKKLLEDTVTERTIELKKTNHQLSDAFQDIKDSINYAQKIQQSILPVDSKVKAALPDSFILFKPRDIVSGDFYWFGSVNVNGAMHHIIAAADCTGHGVPGAFMSMVGNTILNEIVTTKHIVNPSEILSQLHHGVKTALQQSENESRDGMDICLCSINALTNELVYAGAFNPLWIMRNTGEMEIIKATKSAIGGFTPDDQIFESHKTQLHKGESIYLFTDGYADQFGGELGKKLTAKKFRDAILSVSTKSMKEQGFYLDNFIEIWKGQESQVDDILVIGVKF